MPENSQKNSSIYCNSKIRSWIKTGLSLLLSLFLFCSFAPPVEMKAISITDFEDLDQRAWYWPYIDACLKRGWLSGKEANRFDPDGLLKRGDLCLILYRMEGSHSAYTHLPFEDIDTKSYYYEAICWAYAGGFIKGYEDNTFRAEESISRQDLLTILYRYMLTKAPITSYANFSDYEDGAQIAEYAAAPLAWGINKNAIGSSKKLEAFKTATRAESAKILIQTSQNPLPKQMRIEIRDQVFYASLQENDSAQAFYQRLPVSKWMKEYEGREKFCYLQDTLPTNPVKADKVFAGDLMLQNDNALVLFYQDYESSYRYTPIAHIDSDDIPRLQDVLKSDNLVISFY